MDRLFEELRTLIRSAGEQVLVATVLAFYVIVFAILTIPESISSVTSLGELAWDQLSSPSPQAPTDLTFRLIKIWTNHLVDVQVPRLRYLTTRFDWKLAFSLRSLERPLDRARTSQRSLLVRLGSITSAPAGQAYRRIDPIVRQERMERLACLPRIWAASCPRTTESRCLRYYCST